MTTLVPGSMINQTTLFTSSSLYSGNINTGNIAAGNVSVTGTLPPPVGIYANAANSLALATNSAARLIVDANGNVGINVGTPVTGLQINSTVATTWSSSDSSNNSFTPYPNEIAIINNQLNTTNSFAGIFFQGGQLTAGSQIHSARIGVINDGTAYGAAMAFATRNATSATMTEALRITSVGNVGINSTTPVATLDVGGIINTTTRANMQVSGAESTTVPNITFMSRFGGRKYGYFSPTANGAIWARAIWLPPRYAFKINISTTGGNYNPSATTFTCLLDWTGTLYAGGTAKLAPQYVTQIRAQSSSSGSNDYYLELYFNAVTALQGFYISVENLTASDTADADFNVMNSGPGQSASGAGTFGTNLANLAFTSSTVVL